MSAALEKLLEEERLDARKEITKNLIKGGNLSNEQIAYAVGIPLEEVNKIAEEL